jgi:UDP-N-acetylglucosamine 2-epimerase
MPHLIIHTGQYYSPNMDAQFFQDLELPEPHYRLEGVAGKKHTEPKRRLCWKGLGPCCFGRAPEWY